MNTKMKKYTTPELSVLTVEIESVLCTSGFPIGQGASIEKWNEDTFDWDD